MRFSLVIPIAPDRRAEILDSIEKLDYPKKEYETIIERGNNPSLNRNKGSSRSNGDIIVFLDDDATLPKDYLTNVDDFFKKNPKIDIVGGPQLTPKDDKGFARISGYALSSKFGAYKLAGRYSLKKERFDIDETSITSANLVCRKKVMKKVQFDIRLFPGEDPKFIADAKREMMSIAYCPKIVLYHRRRPTFKGLIKQIFNYGKVRPLKESIKDTIKMPFFFIPSLFLLYLILCLIYSIMGLFFLRQYIIAYIPLIIYLILCLVFSFIDSINNKDYKAFFFLPLVYPTIHLSYGAGMIYGYLKKLYI